MGLSSAKFYAVARDPDQRRELQRNPNVAPQMPPKTGWPNEKGVTAIRRNPLCCLVPETGLEPALLAQPGPQPGASANSATPAHNTVKTQ